MNFNGFQQISRTVNPAGNALEQCITNIRVVSQSVVHYPVVSFGKWHPPFSVVVSFPFAVRSDVRAPIFDYARGDYLGFYAPLSDIINDIRYECADVDSAVSRLTDLLKSAMDRFIPMKPGSRGKFSWWFSRDLRRALTLKSSCHERYTSSGLDKWHSLFREHRSAMKRLIIRDKCQPA